MVAKIARTKKTAMARASQERAKGFNASVFKKKKGFGVSVTRKK